MTALFLSFHITSLICKSVPGIQRLTSLFAISRGMMGTCLAVVMFREKKNPH